jgi:hypothetical protein
VDVVEEVKEAAAVITNSAQASIAPKIFLNMKQVKKSTPLPIVKS